MMPTKHTGEKLIILAVFLLLLGLMYFFKQVEMYHAWVKNDAIEDFEACMIFNRPDAMCSTTDGPRKCPQAKATLDEAIDHCKAYARDGDLYSPYPWLKALVLIDPNAQ